MKKVVYAVLAAVVFVLSCSSCAVWRKDETIMLDEIQTDAAMKRFKKSSKQNQLEILTYLVQESTRRYQACQTLDELNDLERRVSLIRRYLVSGKQSFMSIQFATDDLLNKITRTKRDATGGSIIYNDNARGYYDFGQELN